MPRNVEVKARLDDLESFKKLAESISDTKAEIIHQHDTFFKTDGEYRLKLRKQSGQNRLISYKRSDKEGPKLSQYAHYWTDNPDSLREVLSQAYSLRGTVEKKRTLYMSGQTRIHVDEVKDLGHFMELEVCLRDDQSLEEGELIGKNLMQQLHVKQSNLVCGAYIDFLEKN
ncbi:uncharacterized protein LOC130614514 [Hydractinia symbiolongicarpus]|uniref:uncharacterized protein LOC130614514 n=1 Tax=Hydractinia symbiolongicarpus TaxID=13093 RepID=UPI00255161A5|nr:uncharacterized protein LOC130614514 [Hydractinia symbiolongicarpus]